MAETSPPALPDPALPDSALLVELEAARASARAQLRLLRDSLATVIGLLQRPPG